jgi:NADH-quinone oxidoreductase subunit C
VSTTEQDVSEETVATDPVREAIARAFADHLGAGFLDQHIRPSRDLWIRIDKGSWVDAARLARNKLGMTWLDFISAIDWLPSPFGREMEAEQDWVVHGREVKETDEHIGITIKADLPDDDLAIETLIPVYAGANWHERELWEMFGIDIVGHPDLRALYLPSEFEGNPMRKDYPLVSRRVKPWPGIVDVEGMPNDGDADDDAGEVE